MLSDTSRWRYLYGIAVPRLILTMALMGTATIAMGTLPENVTKEEMAMSPPYCPYVQLFGNSGGPGNPSPGAKPWVAVMGKTFWAMHHYCWGQINMQRALRSGTPAQTRKYLMTTVRDDYNYVIRNAPSDFILLPEVHTQTGIVELRLSLTAEADRSFARARALKPDYWPAYSHWTEFLINSGRRAEAKQLVKSGLEYSPNAKSLQEQYRLLGGKLSEIVPKVRKQAPEEAPAEITSPPPDEVEKTPANTATELLPLASPAQ